jgi:hypothetical protein
MPAALATMKSVHSSTGSDKEIKKKPTSLLKRIRNLDLKKVVKASDTTSKAMKAPKGLHHEFLITKIHEILPEQNKVIDPKLFRKCFSFAKQSIPSYGSTLIHFKMDVNRASRLTYTEFLVFLCLLTRCVFNP